MRNSVFWGMVLTAGGILVIVFGFLSLSILSDWCLVNQNTGCPSSNLIVNFVLYMSTVGSTLSMLGIWTAAPERIRIFSEGAGVTLVIGLLVLVFSFSLFGTLNSLSFLLLFSPYMPREFVYLLGLAGGWLFMGGVIKLGVGEKNISPSEIASIQGGVVPRDPRFFYEVSAIIGLSFIATLLSGALVSNELVTPGGGGFYWGFPYSWKSVSGWLGTSYGFQYDWFWFVMDVLSYIAMGFFALFLFWTNSGIRGKERIRRIVESKKLIGIMGVIAVIIFAGSFLYDYAFLWNQR